MKRKNDPVNHTNGGGTPLINWAIYIASVETLNYILHNLPYIVKCKR